MSTPSRLRGHAIECVHGNWIYADTREPTKVTYKTRPCGHCGQTYTREGHDACLGTLRGVMNACCGHGTDTHAYVQFWDGTGVYGSAAVGVMARLKRMEP